LEFPLVFTLKFTSVYASLKNSCINKNKKVFARFLYFLVCFSVCERNAVIPRMTPAGTVTEHDSLKGFFCDSCGEANGVLRALQTLSTKIANHVAVDLLAEYSVMYCWFIVVVL